MSTSGDEGKAAREFEELLEYVKRSRGFDFTGYKRSSLQRRVSKRLQTLKLEHFSDYLDYLEVDPEEFVRLFNTILINVTAFFRDPAAWECLSTVVIPRIVADKRPQQAIRVWSAGCASGEEAYTLAIVLAEALGVEDFRQRVKIYATDADEEALGQARQANYSAKDLQPVAAALQTKYFEPIGNRFVFRPDLRRTVIFGRHDLIQDAPISRLDLLLCRNTLMYFNAEIQNRILARFHFALNDTGYIFLGKAETLLTRANLFTPIELKYRLFTKVSKAHLRDRMLIIAQAGNVADSTHPAAHVRDVAFDMVPTAQVVVDTQGRLALANQEARTLFGLIPPDIGRPFHELDVSYRPVELRARIEQVYADRRPVQVMNVERALAGGLKQHLDIALLPLMDTDGSLLGVGITFHDVTHHQRLQAELERHKQELETAYEELQSTNEELETTNEELQSTVEELETTNEELQSTNEELETMNEELQASNEELQTVNDELRERTDELNRTNAFQESILASLHVAAVVVDRNSDILTWNQHANELWGLYLEELQDRSLLNLDIGLPVEQLQNPIRAVLNREMSYQEIVLDAMNRRGRTIRCRVTCAPLRGVEHEVQGVILLMEEWSA